METSVNNKCRAFTSIEQSRKLAEILPLDTADQTYATIAIAGANFDIPEEQQYIHKDIPFVYYSGVGVPCWSLSALLEATSKAIVINKVEGNTKYIFSSSRIGTYTTADNAIDACYEMILKLNELNLL